MIKNLKMRKYFLLFCFLLLPACFNFGEIPVQQKKTVKEDSILLLQIKGIINTTLAEAFMEQIRKYANNTKIKAVLVRINSPGGTVGASQEINQSIEELREFYKKPVYVSGGDLVASGAVYSIMSAEKIFVNPGALFGSIGALMEFQNLSELSRWAKIDFYTLKAGEFKDSGNPFRQMTLRERELFENLLNNALDQFKDSIAKGRGLDPKVVESFSDGRVFSGEMALSYGLVDAIGSFNQVLKELGEKTGLGSSPKLFEPGKKSSYEKFFDAFSSKNLLDQTILSFLSQRAMLSGRPLYILPSYLSPQ